MSNSFKKGDRVIYIPNHVKRDKNHYLCEHGVVKSINPNYPDTVFVIYDNSTQKMITGDEPFTAMGTNINNLVLEEKAN